MFQIQQNRRSLVEYYTEISAIWEELEAMNTMPVLTTITPEISVFIKALETQKQESRIFQFLNGLDEDYSPQRSQILMMPELPRVEMACYIIQ